MKDKIYRGFIENKVLFYVLYFIYAEILSAFTWGFFYADFILTFTFIDSPYIIVTTDTGKIVITIINFIGWILLLLPPIWITVRTVKDKEVSKKVGKIVLLWLCGVVAGIVAIILVINEWSLFSYLAKSLLEFLDSCFQFYEKCYPKISD